MEKRQLKLREILGNTIDDFAKDGKVLNVAEAMFIINVEHQNFFDEHYTEDVLKEVIDEQYFKRWILNHASNGCTILVPKTNRKHAESLFNNVFTNGKMSANIDNYGTVNFLLDEK